jgi:hypothetical protein
MKKKNSYKPLKAKIPAKTIPKSIGIKLGLLLCVIIPIALIIAGSMNMNFFSITRIISIFVLIISIIAYIKGELIYSHPEVAHHGNAVGNKKTVVHKKYNTNFSFSLNKGTVQVVLSTLIVILCTYLGQVIYRAMG